MVRWSLVAVAAAVSVCATAAFAQPMSRTATTAGGATGVAGLLSRQADRRPRQPRRITRPLSRSSQRCSGAGQPASSAPPDATSKPIFVYWRERPTRTDGEIRGEFWDLGRLTENDSRFSSFDFRPLLESMTQGRWPPRDQIFVITNASLVEATLPEAPTLRAIALAPERYENRSATVSGRFRGRNLLGDIATPLPMPGKWDFVLQSADAAVWVSGLQTERPGLRARSLRARRYRPSRADRRNGAPRWQPRLDRGPRDRARDR